MGAPRVIYCLARPLLKPVHSATLRRTAFRPMRSPALHSSLREKLSPLPDWKSSFKAHRRRIARRQTTPCGRADKPRSLLRLRVLAVLNSFTPLKQNKTIWAIICAFVVYSIKKVISLSEIKQNSAKTDKKEKTGKLIGLVIDLLKVLAGFLLGSNL